MGSIIRVFARLLQLITAVLRRRGQRRQAQKPKAPKREPAVLTAHQRGSIPKGGPNRRARRQQKRQHADEVFGLVSNADPPMQAAPDPPPVAPPTASKEELDSRQRTMPLKVVDTSQFAPTAASAFEHKYNNVMLTVQGRVTKRLPTDTIGAHHQRFIVTLPNGQSILVVHNIDDAPRVPLRVGDEVEVRGRYLWNEQGGEMHWTHHDPLGKLAGGYIELLSTQQRYQ